MFRRRTSNEASQFDAGSEKLCSGLLAGSRSSSGGHNAGQTASDVSISAIRQQSAKRRSSDAAGGSTSPATAQTVNSVAGQLPAVSRARVSSRPQHSQQQQVPQVAGLQKQQHNQQRSHDNATHVRQESGDDCGMAASEHMAAAAPDQPLHASTRLPATLQQQQEQSLESDLPPVHQCLPELGTAAAAPEDPAAASATVLQQQQQDEQQQPEQQAHQQQQRHQPNHEHLTQLVGHFSGSPLKHSLPLSAGLKTIRFEVQPADLCSDSNLIDYDGHDQSLPGAAGAPTQHYIYHEETGQLCRVGQGADSGRSARHYLEDWNTGEFFQLAQPSTGCFTWLRRKPHTAPPPGWSNSSEEPSALRSLADFTDNMGSAMAALGLFAQGLAGGLALLCLFMAYLQYAARGRDGFLAYYSAFAQMVNRAFFTLISLSMVAAASRLAYDSLGRYRPQHLKLKVVDVLVLALYLVAYTTNLLATPTDDRLTYEALRDLQYWRLALPAAFVHKLGTWHVLNLFRVVGCGLAWCLVCYRSNPYVMMAVFQAREQQQEEEGGNGLVLGLATPPAAVDPAGTPTPGGACAAAGSASASPARKVTHHPGASGLGINSAAGGPPLDGGGYAVAGSNGSLTRITGCTRGHAVAGWSGSSASLAEGVMMGAGAVGDGGQLLQQQQQQLGTPPLPSSPLRHQGSGGIGSGRLAPGVVSAAGMYAHHSSATNASGSPSRLGLTTYSS